MKIEAELRKLQKNNDKDYIVNYGFVHQCKTLINFHNKHMFM